MDEYTTMTTGGIYGPTWKCDDLAEAEAIAEEHGYEVLDVQEAGDDGMTILVVA